jgi:hypothetical protein
MLANTNHLLFPFHPFDSLGISSSFWPCWNWIKKRKWPESRRSPQKNEKEILSEIIWHDFSFKKSCKQVKAPTFRKFTDRRCRIFGTSICWECFEIMTNSM